MIAAAGRRLMKAKPDGIQQTVKYTGQVYTGNASSDSGLRPSVTTDTVQQLPFQTGLFHALHSVYLVF